MTTNKLTAAIAAIRAGDKSSGRLLLFEIVKEEPANETAWLWLSVCVDNVEQKKYSLSQALAINPSNQNARKVLAQLEQPQQPSVEDIVFRPISKPKNNEESILPPSPIATRPDSTITTSSAQKPDNAIIIKYILLTLVIVLACSSACIFSVKFILPSSTNLLSSPTFTESDAISVVQNWISPDNQGLTCKEVFDSILYVYINNLDIYDARVNWSSIKKSDQIFIVKAAMKGETGWANYQWRVEFPQKYITTNDSLSLCKP